MQCDSKKLGFYDTKVYECPAPATMQVVIVNQTTDALEVLAMCASHYAALLTEFRAQGWVQLTRKLERD